MQQQENVCYICAGKPYPNPKLKHASCSNCISQWYETTSSICSKCKADIESIKKEQQQKTDLKENDDVTVTQISSTIYKVSNGLGNVIANVKDLDKVIETSRNQLNQFNNVSTSKPKYDNRRMELCMAFGRQTMYVNCCAQD